MSLSLSAGRRPAIEGSSASSLVNKRNFLPEGRRVSWSVRCRNMLRLADENTGSSAESGRYMLQVSIRPFVNMAVTVLCQ